MIQGTTQVRVRYADTDQMSYVYYGKYPEYLEVGRTELIRNLGITYKEMEEMGIMLPVSELHIKYIRPAKYDDLLRIITTVPEMPTIKLRTLYEVYNQNDTLIIKAEVVLPFVDMTTGKITKIPDTLKMAFEANWQPTV